MSDPGEEAFGHIGRALGKVAREAGNQAEKGAKSRQQRDAETMKRAGVAPAAPDAAAKSREKDAETRPAEDKRSRERDDERER